MKSQILAIEWDTAEGRLVLASRKGRSIRIDAAHRIELPETTDSAEREALLQEKMRAVVEQHRAGKADCLLAVGRSTVELKHLTLPPAPDGELPELVRFQALREFATVGEDWPIDFLPIDKDPDQPRHVLAATINPQVVERIRDACEGLGLEVQSIVVRPCGMASLVARQFHLSDDNAYLLIDPLDNQIDLAVVQGGSTVFLRCARADCCVAQEEDLKSIVLEVRRTIAAATNRMGGHPLAAIYVCGNGRSQQSWASRLREEFKVDVQTFDPFADLDLAPEVARTPPEERSRYAPLIGMLRDAADEKRHPIDFLNPRQVVEPPDQRRKQVLIAAGIAAVLLMGAAWLWLELKSLDDQIADLTKRSTELTPLVKKSQEIEKRVEGLDKWAQTDIDWLEELRRLSTKMPPADQAMLTQLRADVRVDGGELDLTGLVKTQDSMTQLGNGLRDAQHSVEHKATQQSSKDSRYQWSFRSAVLVDTEPPAEAASPQRASAGVRTAATGGGR